MADVIVMNPQAPPNLGGRFSPPRQEHDIKPKGHAIPGIDYGIDMVNDAPEAPKAPAEQASNGGSASSPPPPHHEGGPQGQGQGGFRTSPQDPPEYRPNSPVGMQGRGFQGGGFQGGMQDGFQGGGMDQVSQSRSASPQGFQPSGGFQMPGFIQQDAQSVGVASHAGQGFVDEQLMNNMNMGSVYEPQERPLSFEEKRKRRIDGLAALARLEDQGYVQHGKKCSATTPLPEIEETVSNLTSQRDLDNSIKFQRKILVGFATLVESVCENEEYNIFDLNLEGWSESVYENIHEYDDVFEELYLKYKDTAKIPVEIKLISMVAGSAWMFHMSQNMFGKARSKVPGFDEVMKNDPELKRHYQESAAALARQRGVPVPDKKKDKNGFGFLGQLFGGGGGGDMFGGGKGPSRAPRHRQPQQHAPHQPHPQPQEMIPPRRTRARIPMDEPEDVDNLLSSLTGGGGNYVGEEIELDLSEMENLSDLE